MWELDNKEGRALKNWCFWNGVLEKTLESLLDSKGIKPVSLKRNQHWILIGKTDAEAEAPILQYLTTWCKDKLIGKDPDAGKDWRREKGTTEDEMVGWHHQLNGHVWASSRRWWRTGKPGMLQSMGSQGVGHDWVTGLIWSDHMIQHLIFCCPGWLSSLIQWTWT